MKIRQLFFLLALCCGSIAHGQYTQTVDISTHDLGSPTWQVLPPGGSVQNAVRCYLNVWGNPPSGLTWVSPSTFVSGYAPTACGAGTYKYKTTFSIPSTCQITGATLNIATLGTDDSLEVIRVNGHTVVAGLPGNPSQNYTFFATGIMAPLSAGTLNTGTNTVEIWVRNAVSYSGLMVDGNLTINYSNTLIPGFTGNAQNYCQGASVTLTAAVTGTVGSYSWTATECDAGGNPVGGTTWTSGAIVGTPGICPLPAGISGTCGKSFKITLAVKNSCITSWVEHSEIITIICPPVADAGRDITICPGQCVSIGGPTQSRVLYNWSYVENGISNNAGNTASITVCPQTTTTYTVAARSLLFGCTTTDQAIVTVLPNNPNFTVAFNRFSDYYTITATPVELYPSGAPAGFGYSWIFQELDAAGNPVYTIDNPYVWWSSMINTLIGFDRIVSYSGTVNVLPSSPSPGKLAYNKTYRLTRGTWTDACLWNQQSQSVLQLKLGSRAGAEVPITLATEDVNAPDFSYIKLKSDTGTKEKNRVSSGPDFRFDVYPNPSTGMVTVTADALDGVLDVYDASGRKIYSVGLKAGSVTMDLSAYIKGVYVLSLRANGQKYSRKIILE